MNNKKICFISCVNDPDQYAECLTFIANLEVPSGFVVETLAVEDATSMAAGYHFAMRASDAKYKVYLHQDVRVLNKHFLFDMIKLFTENPNLGLLGMTGTRLLHRNGLSPENVWSYFGTVYDNHSGKMEQVSYNEVNKDIQELQAISGMLMVTQYDLPWRDDLFHGWDFYHLSQSVEFLQAGYTVGVPRQQKPWIMHDCGVPRVNSDVEEDNNRFWKQYGPFLDSQLPLVSVLIPTYNRPDLFELALQSVLAQTYPRIEIIIGDDSTNDETQVLMQKYLAQHSNITYIRNPVNLGQFDNDLMLMEQAQGEFINFLMDDDLFHPKKIESMMRYFLLHPDLTLVTSKRTLIDEHDNELPDKDFNISLPHDILVEGHLLGDLFLKNNWNFLGEPTTVLFRKSSLKEPFGTFAGRRYICNVDTSTWLNILAEGKAVFINEAMSSFRLHNGQQQQSQNMQLGGLMDLAHSVIESPAKGFLQTPEDRKQAYFTWLSYAKGLLCTMKPESNEIQQKIVEVDNTFWMMAREYEFLIHTEPKLPLVSILIPAYNRPKLLEEALKSALLQTYRNIEIIICDDSTNDGVKQMLQPYLKYNKNIRYYKNETNLNLLNPQKCLDLSSGEYVNFLMDDDLLHPEKIERMMQYFLNLDNITLVTSYRHLIDMQTKILPDQVATRRLYTQATHINGLAFGSQMLKQTTNFIGEPTTVLFRKNALTEPFGFYRGKPYHGLNDVAAWLHLLSKGDAIYLPEPLSFFRQHEGQNQRDVGYIRSTILMWVTLIQDAREDGFLNKQDDYKTALLKHLHNCHHILSTWCVGPDRSKIPSEYPAAMNELIKELMSHQDPYACPFCTEHFQQFVPWPDKYDFPGYLFEMHNKETAVCPFCGAIDRERLFRLFIERETDMLQQELRVLHVAPEYNLRRWLSQEEKLHYTCGDLFPQDDQMERLDLTEIAYPDETFDVILCSHVLEHIPDDIRAMSELYRVLKRGGWGILQVPIATSIEQTYEDFSILSPEDRLRVFGQEDHVRIYARDYVDRLKSVGFEVRPYNLADQYSLEEAQKYGLSSTDNLYVVYKHAGGSA